VRPHAHFVAEDRHFSGDGQAEADDPEGSVAQARGRVPAAPGPVGYIIPPFAGQGKANCSRAPETRRGIGCAALSFRRYCCRKAQFLGPVDWEEGRVVFRRSTRASKEKPGVMTRASQSTKRKEVGSYAHIVAEDRHFSGDDQARQGRGLSSRSGRVGSPNLGAGCSHAPSPVGHIIPPFAREGKGGLRDHFPPSVIQLDV